MDKPKFGTKMENIYICYLQKHKVKGTALDLLILELKGIVCDRFIKKQNCGCTVYERVALAAQGIPEWVQTSHWDCLLGHLNEMMVRSNTANSSTQAASKCVLSQKERGYPHAYLCWLQEERMGDRGWGVKTGHVDVQTMTLLWTRGTRDGTGKTAALPAGM